MPNFTYAATNGKISGFCDQEGMKLFLSAMFGGGFHQRPVLINGLQDGLSGALPERLDDEEVLSVGFQLISALFVAQRQNDTWLFMAWNLHGDSETRIVTAANQIFSSEDVAPENGYMSAPLKFSGFFSKAGMGSLLSDLCLGGNRLSATIPGLETSNSEALHNIARTNTTLQINIGSGTIDAIWSSEADTWLVFGVCLHDEARQRVLEAASDIAPESAAAEEAVANLSTKEAA